MLLLRRFYFIYIFIWCKGNQKVLANKSPGTRLCIETSEQRTFNTVHCESTYASSCCLGSKKGHAILHLSSFLWPCTKKNEMTACPFKFRVDWWALLSCCAARFTPLLMSQQAFIASQILVWNNEYTLTHRHSKYTLHLFAALICPGIRDALSLPLLPWLWCLRY